MPLDENYFGLGDKAGHMNRRNRSFTMWNTDEFGWQESSDPLYKDHSVFYRVAQRFGLRNIFRQRLPQQFRFWKGIAGLLFVWSRRRRAELLLFFRSGAEENHSELHRDGGPHTAACRSGRWDFSKAATATTRKRGRAKSSPTYRQKKIPLDAIYFDIDYQQGNAPFTINRQYFPTFEKMISDFRSQGVRTIADHRPAHQKRSQS